jgi:hypothetical protein
VDASVILRLAFGQPNALAEWPKIQRGVASAHVTTENLRSLDRLRLRAKLSDVIKKSDEGHEGTRMPLDRSQRAPACNARSR